jgi:hypothetical protein
MDRQDNQYDSAVDGVADVIEDALSFVPKPEPGEPRDPTWLRWVKFSAVIIVPAVLLGLGLLFVDYVTQFSGNSYYERQRAERRVEHDSVQAMKWRFVIGSCIGGGLGLVYVVRCIVRKVDP